MHKKLCLMQANCQGEELETLLMASPAFSKVYRLVRHTNYTRENIPAEEVAACDIFLYQFLGPGWGELSSQHLLAGLSPKALALQIPNMFFKGYWPLWTGQGPIAFGDALLNRLIDEGAPKPVILNIYMKKDIQSFVDLHASLEGSVAVERGKEAGVRVASVDFILEHWQRRPMFHTVNHPGAEVLTHVANGILAALDLPLLAVTGGAANIRGGNFSPSYADFDLPVHPQVARFHGLDFGGAEQTYAVFGRRMTFAEYVSRYIDCRLNGLDSDFMGYLQLV